MLIIRLRLKGRRVEIQIFYLQIRVLEIRVFYLEMGVLIIRLSLKLKRSLLLG